MSERDRRRWLGNMARAGFTCAAAAAFGPESGPQLARLASQLSSAKENPDSFEALGFKFVPVDLDWVCAFGPEIGESQKPLFAWVDKNGIRAGCFITFGSGNLLDADRVQIGLISQPDQTGWALNEELAREYIDETLAGQLTSPMVDLCALVLDYNSGLVPEEIVSHVLAPNIFAMELPITRMRRVDLRFSSGSYVAGKRGHPFFLREETRHWLADLPVTDTVPVRPAKNGQLA